MAPTDIWQREFARALQTWANSSNLNFHEVPDDGSPCELSAPKDVDSVPHPLMPHAGAESSTDVAVATRIASSKSSSATRQPSSTSGRDLRTLAWPRPSSCASPASSLAMEAADAVRGGSC